MIAAISAGGGLLVAIVAGVFGIVHTRRQKSRDAAISQKVEVVREQVQNSHGTNLRNDLDRGLAASEAALAAVNRIERMVLGVTSDIRGMRRDIGRGQDQTAELRRDLSAHVEWVRAQEERLDRQEGRLGVLENTFTPEEES